MPPSQDSEFPEPDSMTVDPANLGSVDPFSVEGIFLVALSKSGLERDAFLGVQCVDSSQRQRVEALLHAYEQAGDFLQKPAVVAEPTPISQYLEQCALPGTLGKLGPYEILEEIGRGGMGVVFRAHDPKLQRIVAVKALAPELARLPSSRQRFLREARAAAAVSHPHVVTIFAVEGTEEASLGTERTTLPYLVMECIVGQTLHDKIKRVGALKVEEIIRISRQIAEGLTAAHKRGLIHRDIKPANILLENGVERVKITDFGLARTTSDGGITHTGEILGTPQCMSPEQARGEIVDQRSDLFSLGCVMYTMCTGFSPFRADNMLAVMKKVCEESPRPIAQINPHIPEWLCELVHRLLEKEPERRVQTAGDVVEVLESRVVANAPRAVSTHPPEETKSTRQDAETIPRWLLAPIIPQFVRDAWKSCLPDLIVSSAACGMIAASMPDSMLYFATFSFFAVVWLILLFAKRKGRGRWHWVTWPMGAVSLLSLYLGMLLTVWVRVEAHSRSGIFVFGLAVGVFWLLTRWFPMLFIQTRPSQPSPFPGPVSESVVGQPVLQVADRPRFPWLILEWVIVATLGIAILSSLGFATVWIMSYLPAPGEIGPRAYCVIRTPVAENVKYVTIDGKRATLEPGGPGEWRTTTTQGTREIYVAYDSDSVLNQERFFTTTANIGPARVTIITADPVMVRSLTRPQGIEVPISVPDSPTGPLHSPPGELSERLQSSSSNPSTTELTSSIPLADAVEVLTDPKTMPAPCGVEPRSSTGQIQVMTQAVWVDEPGLVIRMKRMGFEGNEGSEIEYYSKVAWGTGPFMATNELGENPCHFPVGRYKVLVQDLDYGWPLDRRGTVAIGNGPVYVHVKRTFLEHQRLSSGADQFPLAFRWAGKTYQIETPDEVQIVNGLLAATAEKKEYITPESFRTHPLFLEAVDINAQSGGHSLRHHRTLAQVKIQSPGMLAGFRSPLGSLSCSPEFISPGGVFVPRQGLETLVTDKLVGWGVYGWKDYGPIAMDESLMMTQVARRDRGFIRRFAEAQPEDGVGMVLAFYFRWFDDASFIKPKSVPAVRRLVAAWADGQPAVPEAELLQLGEVSSWEELWMEKSPEGSAVSSGPKFLIAGSMSGTWRIKEPPEGALAPN